MREAGRVLRAGAVDAGAAFLDGGVGDPRRRAEGRYIFRAAKAALPATGHVRRDQEAAVDLAARVAPVLFLLGFGTVAVAQAGPAVVRVAMPVTATATESYEVPGRTEPLESARIFTRANRIVRERRFDIGDRVAAGDVLAVIDAPDLDRAVDAARAAREQAEVRYTNAKEVAERVPALVQARERWVAAGWHPPPDSGQQQQP